MEILKLFANRDPKNAKIVLATTLAVAAIVGVAATDTGARVFSQLGIAQTVAAAERGLQQTGDALKSFVGRSPGERGATDVLKGKKKRAALAKANAPDGAAPAQRALGKIFDKPVESVASAIAPPVAAVALPDTVEFDAPVAGLPLAVVNPRILAPGIGGVGGGGSGGGGGGSGGGGSGGDVTGPPTVPTVIGAVPEPSTWLFMLFGFGAIGASLRRRAGTNGFSISRRAGHCETN